MANYDNLKNSISNTIKANGSQAITGDVLQSALLSMINTLGENAAFAGIARLSTNPGTPDGNVFYLATDFGTYNNFKTPSNSIPPNVPLSVDGKNITFFYNSGDGWKVWTVTAPASLGEVIPSTVFADEQIPNGSVAFAKTPGTYILFENATLASNEVCIFTKNKGVWNQMKFSVGGGGTGGGIGEAPDDGKAYVRRSTEWVNIKETAEYKELPTKAVINAIPRETKITLIKQRGYDQSGECYLSARLDNANIINSASDGYFADCKLFLLRMKRKKSYVGLDQGDGARKRKYSGRGWAETGIGLYSGTYDHQVIPGDLSEVWPTDAYMWDITGDIIQLFGGRDLKNIEALPIGLRRSLVTYNQNGDKIPLGVGKLINRYVRDMPADATYTDVNFKLTSYKSNLTCATFGIALYKKISTRNTKGNSWERISNIAALKIKQDSKGTVKITIL